MNLAGVKGTTANAVSTGVQLKVPQLCEDRSRPACCYPIVSVYTNE